MPRFSSLKYVPAETRRILRDRLARHLPVSRPRAPVRDSASITSDAIALQVLERMTVVRQKDWAMADAAYRAFPRSPNEPCDLQDAIDKGWIRKVWERAEIPEGVRMAALRAPTGDQDAFKALVKGIHDERYAFHATPPAGTDVSALIAEIAAGQRKPSDLAPRTPGWVAARLWETIRSTEGIGAQALRRWIDLWAVLGWPALAPSEVWAAADAEIFEKAVFERLAAEPTLGGWAATRDMYERQVALEHGATGRGGSGFLPSPPETLIGRALWTELPVVERAAYGSLDTFGDVFGGVGLVVDEIDAQENAHGPHPRVVEIVELALERAELLIWLLLQIRNRPRLLADLLLEPRTTALACFLIARWRSLGGAWDRELVDRDFRAGQAEAFTDAVAILAEQLHRGADHAGEAAALFAWLHSRAGEGLDGSDVLLAILRNELANSPRSTLLAMAKSIQESALAQGVGGADFAAFLGLADLGDLANDLDAEAVIEAYQGSVSAGAYNLSAHRISLGACAILAGLSQRTPEARSHFLDPVDVRAQLAAIGPANNPYSVKDEVGRGLRTHIRVLTRALVAGPKDVPDDLIRALVGAVRSGSDDHPTKGRIAAFAPRFEKPVVGKVTDKPLAEDLAAALRRLNEKAQKSLLGAILETDEPMVLAQLRLAVPRGLRSAIEDRIAALTPGGAAQVHSLMEMQGRIDELLSAGAAEAAGLYIEAERSLQTLGPVQGRASRQFQAQLHLEYLRKNWEAIGTAVIPNDLAPLERQAAQEALAQFRGIAALKRADADPAAARAAFGDLFRKHPSVGNATNWLAASVSELLKADSFAILDAEGTRKGQQVFSELDRMLSSLPGMTRDEALDANRGLLLLALDRPGEVLGILGSASPLGLDGNTAAYRAVALARLGRISEATATLDEAEYTLGKPSVLDAARAHIVSGAPYLSAPAVSVLDSLLDNMGSAIARFRQLGAPDQSRILRRTADPLVDLLVDHVRAAGDALIELVPMLGKDRHEDDLSAVLQRILAARLDFLEWTVRDQSKGGYSAKGNPGERDLMIKRGEATLAIIESVICDRPLTQDSQVADLESHFQKLLGYGVARIFFHVTYARVDDKAELLKTLEAAAEHASPRGFKHLRSELIPFEESRPPGFIARYTGESGEITVIFLVLNIDQQRQRDAGKTAGATKTRRAPPKPRTRRQDNLQALTR
jgi:hypothetical protein